MGFLTRRKRLRPEEVAAIRGGLAKAVRTQPRIGVVGQTGVGKTSTINALFGTKLLVSNVLPGTKGPTATNVSIPIKPTEERIVAPRGEVTVIDMPGIGEEKARDPEILAMYRELLPTVDVVLWVTKCTRNLAPDQGYIADVRPVLKPEIFDRIVFCLNRVDQFDEGTWLDEVKAPDQVMERGIAVHIDRVARVFSVSPARIVVYAAKWNYHLDALLNAMLDAIPAERSLALDSRALLPDPIAQMDPSIQRIAEGRE